ncbi:DUF805 domain-containing protein [Bartonella sp. HY329]|uniref:DUF805 domain-containing protein n=1 Tax=unclassified Bartonella TaxID=2645622 RepID=UPI0021CA324B|nr:MULTISPECIES: DUF805 domain-containing protein [unclassified Bartonella]UXM94771.1 DUF805 domain-containing protein [Bartonella sp. HY329]UXN09094.1 DUF805 domain-containing protein [Bartonella sp. HY328]
MGFFSAVSHCLRHGYFDFDSRASKSEFFWFFLFYIMGLILSFLAGLILELARYKIFGYVSWEAAIIWGPFMLFCLATIFPCFTVMVRRAHDQNLSGIWILAIWLLAFIPYVNMLSPFIVLGLMLLDGTQGENKFGPAPMQNSDE